jgi:hypothetical protein
MSYTVAKVVPIVTHTFAGYMQARHTKTLSQTSYPSHPAVPLILLLLARPGLKRKESRGTSLVRTLFSYTLHTHVISDSLGARPAHSAQSGEARDKWKDPETPYLPPINLHWDYAMKSVIKTQSRVHTPYVIDRGYRFPEPALLLGPKLPERLQAYLANWLACRPLWIGRIDHDPPRNYPSPQVWRDFLGSGPSLKSQSIKGKEPERKGPTMAEKHKLVMRNLFGDDLLDTQCDTFSPEGVVEFRGEQISVTSLASPPALLTQKITWELFELGFRYELKDLDRYLARARWADDPVGREELLHGIFPSEAGLVMWLEPFPSENYGLWNNTLMGCLPYLENF